MVDGDSCGDGCSHLILIVGDILHVDVGCHRRKGDDGVEHIVDAADDHGCVHVENVVGITVEEAYDDKNQRVANHNGFIPNAVDEFAYHRCQ